MAYTGRPGRNITVPQESQILWYVNLIEFHADVSGFSYINWFNWVFNVTQGVHLHGKQGKVKGKYCDEKVRENHEKMSK